MRSFIIYLSGVNTYMYAVIVFSGSRIVQSESVLPLFLFLFVIHCQSAYIAKVLQFIIFGASFLLITE